MRWLKPRQKWRGWPSTAGDRHVWLVKSFVLAEACVSRTHRRHRRCRPPVLKTGTITGPHALPRQVAKKLFVSVRCGGMSWRACPVTNQSATNCKDIQPKSRNKYKQNRHLWAEGAVPVLRTASKEAVMHHALGKEQEQNYHDNYKQKLSNFYRERRSSGRFLLIHDCNPGCLRT